MTSPSRAEKKCIFIAFILSTLVINYIDRHKFYVFCKNYFFCNTYE